MRPRKRTVADEIGSNDIHKEIIKAVRWHKLIADQILDQIKDVTEKYGKEAVQAAANELLDCEQGPPNRFSLKPELYVHCRQLLGPMPSEWADWWKNADGTVRKGKPKVWPPHREGFDDPPTFRAADDQAFVTLTNDEIYERIQAERRRYNSFSTNSAQGKDASRKLDILYDECKRRNLTIPVLKTGEEPARDYTAFDLRDLTAAYVDRKDQAKRYAGRPAGKTALEEIAKIEAEFQARNSPLPEKPRRRAKAEPPAR